MVRKPINRLIIKSIRSLRTDLLVIFLCSIITIFLIDFWLIDIPELFKGGAKLGQILYKLCFAYISAFIFYFLVVHLKNQKDKENFYGYISSNTSMVIGQAKALIISLENNSGIKLNSAFPDSLELQSICRTIDPNAKAPLVFGYIGNYATWLQYLDYFKKRSNEASNKVLSKVQFIESELVKKLAEIEDCSHFKEITMFSNLKIGNTDLSAFEPSLAEYFKLISDLETYYVKNLKKYETQNMS